jgi:uncharacterized membrane protein YqjE
MHALRRLAATVIELVQTRLELAVTEFDEVRVRFVYIAVAAAAALFLLAFGLASLTLLIVVLYWDTHRLAAIAVFTILYFAGAGAAAWYVASQLRAAQSSFAATLEELRRDRDELTVP